MPPAAAAAGGGGNTAKIVGIVVAAVLVLGGVAFALTRDGDGGGNTIQGFCDKAKALHNDIDLNEAFDDPAKVDKVVDSFGQLLKAAPEEIKADMNTLDAAIRKAGAAIKADKDPSEEFTDEDGAKIDTATTNIENFGKDKCGSDFLLSSASSDSFSSDSTDDSTSSSSSSSRSSSSSSTSAAFEVTDAVQTRDELIDLAQGPGAADLTEEPPIPAWTNAFPLDFIGSARPATPTEVSGFVAVFSKVKEVDFLAFAVLDTQGVCAGGVLEFDSEGTSVSTAVSVPGSAIQPDCSADAVREAAGY